MHKFEVGRLVEWQGGDYAVVIDVDFKQVKVRIDGDPDPKIFNSEAGVIAPVDLSTFDMVIRRSTGSAARRT